MSTIYSEAARNLAGAVYYMSYGRPMDKTQFRGAAVMSDLGNTPEEVVGSMLTMMHGKNRSRQGQLFTHSWSPDELDATNPEHVKLAVWMTYELLGRAHPGSPRFVVAHVDSQSGVLHTHGVIPNHRLDNGRSQDENKMHYQIAKINDDLMEELGMEVCQRGSRAKNQQREKMRKRMAKRGLSDAVIENRLTAKDRSIQELEGHNWREWTCDRVDEIVEHVAEENGTLDDVIDKAAEQRISIRKVEKRGKSPSLTYALVHNNGDVMKVGRSKFATTGTKLGDDYTYTGLQEQLARRRGRKKQREFQEESMRVDLEDIEDHDALDEQRQIDSQRDARLSMLRWSAEQEAQRRQEIEEDYQPTPFG